MFQNLKFFVATAVAPADPLLPATHAEFDQLWNNSLV